MIQRITLCAPAIAALVILSACDGRSSIVPTAPSFASGRSVSEAPALSKSSPRSGVLHAAKACPDYHGNAGDFCSITSSNVDAIEVGSKIFYAKALAGGKLDSDLILVPPGSGTSVAFGHVTLELTTTPPAGVVTFSGGTGRFRHFSASIVVSPVNRLAPDFVNWKWDGPYSFADREDEPEAGERS